MRFIFASEIALQLLQPALHYML